MSVAVITGASGLVSCEAVRLFADKGLDVIGIDNDIRAIFLARQRVLHTIKPLFPR